MIGIDDAQGVPESIQSVTVTLPDSSVKNLSYVPGDSRNTPFRGIYVSKDMIPAPASGTPTYVFHATDKDGNSANALSEIMTANPIGYPARSSLNPIQGAMSMDTSVDFLWDAVPGAAFYQVEIYDAQNILAYTLSTTTNSYHLLPGYLKKGALYRYRIITFREFKDQGVDNQSIIPGDLSAMIPFMTAGWTPVPGDVSGDGAIGLEDVMISLQILSGKPGYVPLGADINGDGKIGMPEAIYDLQKVAGLR